MTKEYIYDLFTQIFYEFFKMYSIIRYNLQQLVHLKETMTLLKSFIKETMTLILFKIHA